MRKKGLSDVVTSVLLILIVLAAVVLIWIYVRPVISNARINPEVFSTSLSVIQDSVLITGDNNISFTIKRNSGGGNLIGIFVVLEDDSSNSFRARRNVTLKELESVKVQINRTEHGLSGINKIKVYPIIEDSTGKEVISPVGTASRIISSSGGGGNPPPGPVCGDGSCNGAEICSTCSQDCGVCPPEVLSVSITTPSTDNQWFNTLGIVSLASGNGLRECWWTLNNGGANSSFTCNTTISQSWTEGSKTIRIYANNSDGNVSSASRQFYIDTTNPVVSYNGNTNADGANLYTNYFVVGLDVVETNFANITYYLYRSGSLVNKTIYSSAIYSVYYYDLIDGAYSYNASVVDLAGNVGSVGTRTININTSVPTDFYAIRYFNPISYTPLQPVNVTITAYSNIPPSLGIDECLPIGWTNGSISNSGYYFATGCPDNPTHPYISFPSYYFMGVQINYTYVAIPPAGASGLQVFNGTMAYGSGYPFEIRGATVIANV